MADNDDTPKLSPLEAKAAGLDLWPHTLAQQVQDQTTGNTQEQMLTVLSVEAAIALEVSDANDFAGINDLTPLVLVVLKEPQLDSGEEITVVQMLDREDLLRWTVGLTQRLVAAIGPERSRELMKGNAEIADPEMPRAEAKA